jgi:hypothetical protein
VNAALTVTEAIYYPLLVLVLEKKGAAMVLKRAFGSGRACK